MMQWNLVSDKQMMQEKQSIQEYPSGEKQLLKNMQRWRGNLHAGFLHRYDSTGTKSNAAGCYNIFHQLLLKPWQEFASNVLHARWWKVHDAMPGNLQGFRLLRSKQKVASEWDRRPTEKAK